MTKRILAMLLVLTLVVGLLPINVFAGTAADHTKYTAPLIQHDSAAHVCEHCVAVGEANTTPTWIPWDISNTTLPTGDASQNGGTFHYYLSGDGDTMNVSQANLVNAANGGVYHVVLCLNGKTVKTSNRFYSLKTGGSLTIVDCTAHTEEENGEKVYKAGTMKDATTSGFMFQNDSNVMTGSLNIYDGIFTNNSRSGSSGGAICVQGAGKLNIYGGEFTNNSAGTGGVINLETKNCTAHIEDAVFKGNWATSSAGVLYTNGASVTIKNTLMSGNHAPSAGVIVSKGCPITYENATITGNRTERGDYGAIHHYNSGGTATVTLKGNTKIIGNIYGAADSTVERNLWLRNHAYKVVVNDSSGNVYLSGDAKIGLSFDAGKKTATNDNQYITSQLVNDIDPRGFFSCDNGDYMLDIVDAGGTTGRRMIFADKPEHPHKICAISDCTEHTEEIAFAKWGETSEQQKTLPASGSYYLTNDVVLEGAWDSNNQTDVTLNLCLNGHTISMKDGVSARLFYARNNTKLNITDCDADGDGKTGALMNGTSGAIMTHSSSNGAEVNLYRIGLKNNSRAGSGGTIAAQGNATFNLTDVEISGSSATGSGGVVYAQNSAKINITGGSIHDNRATGNGGVFILTSGSNRLTVKDTEFKNNSTDANGAVLYTEKACTVSFENCTFTENHADSNHAGVAYLRTANATFTGGSMTGNTAKYVSTLNVLGGSCTLNGVKIQNNENTGGYGAVHMNRVDGQVSVTVKGATVISGNTTAGDVAQNLYMRNNASYVTVDGLTDGANVCVTMENARLNAGLLTVSANEVTDAQAAFLHSDNSNYTVKVVDGKARFVTGHEHKLCADSACTEHSDLTWVKWTDSTKLPTSSGNYYLDVDVQLTEINWTGTDKNINICLNGQTVTAAKDCRLVAVQNRTVLTIADCRGTGVLTGGNNDFGGAFSVHADATLNLYGGTITGNHSDDEANGQGGAIYLQKQHEGFSKGGTFNMYGGAISDNTANWGGAVYVCSGAEANILGGTISGNSSVNHGGAIFANTTAAIDIENATFEGNTTQSNGGVVYMTGANSALNISGATFTNNSAKSAGGVILAQSAGTAVTISDSTFTGNTATDGGAVYVSRNTKLAITGGSFTGNTANNGGAVYTAAAENIIDGAQITGNKAAYNGAGVYVNADVQTLTLKGNVKILNNLAEGRANNLYLTGEKLITLDALAEDAKVGVSAAKYDRFISEKNDTDYSKNFLSDSAYRIVSYKDKALYLANSTEHQHCACTGVAASGCEHDTVVWTAWESTNSLPTKDGYYYLVSDVVLSSRANIAGDVKLCLNGHKVSMKEGLTNTRVITVQQGTELSLADCKGSGVITGGNATFGGAVNVNRGSTFNMFGGIFTGNTSMDPASGQGGAIYLQATKDGVVGGTFNMYGGTITGNQSVWGAGVYGASQSNINIYGGTISKNDSSKYGGGVYASTSVTNISNVVLEGNTSGSGGAIYVTGANSKLNITNSKFTDNTVSGYAGGAILALSAGTEITISGSAFTGSKATAGGAVYASSNTKLTVADCTFSGNTADLGASAYVMRCDAKFTKTTMEKNTAKKYAAGVYVSAGTAVFEDITVKNNIGGSGVAFMINSATATIDGKNTILYPTVTLVSGTISGNKTETGSGGAILMQGKSTLIMKGGKISGNSAKYCGGVYASTNSTFKMYSGSISGNYSGSNGGGVHALRSTVYLYGGSITGNSAKGSGGAICLAGAKLYQSGAYIAYNKAGTGTGGGAIMTTSQKAGQTLYEPYIRISGGTITGNEARHGGAILLQGSSKTVLDITGGKITDNKSTVEAGAIYSSTKTTVNMSGGIISGNYTDGRGGAVHHNNSKGNYTGGEIYGNSAKSSGGALLINGSTAEVVMKNMKLYDHTGASGGAICHQGRAHLTMENVEIYNSKAEYSAGAIYVSNNTYLDVVGGSFHDNSAKMTGGCMYFGNNTHIKLDGLTIQNNSTEQAGGAIYARSIDVSIKNCKIIGNKADGTGGAISTYRPALQGVTYGGDFRTGYVIEDTEFRDNQSFDKGGAIFLDNGSKITLKNVTMTGNRSAYEGAAVYATGDFIMNGITATGNISDTDGFAVYLADVLYDGHSFATGVMQLGGDTIVKDNDGGDMYLGETTAVAVLESGLGEKTEIHVTLASGLLTNKIYGAYHYEGGNQVYTITYGDRSLTEPEYDQALAQQGKDAKVGDTLLYVGVGVFVLAIAAVAVLLALKKKKKTPAADTVSE